MKTLPTVLAGPILRRCTTESISIWVATSVKIDQLSAIIRTYKGEAASAFPVKTTSKEIPIGVSFWVYMLDVQPASAQEQFPTETVLAYDIGPKKKGSDSQVDSIEGFDIGEFAYPPYALPTLILQDLQTENLNALYGSCRGSHGNGYDASLAGDEQIRRTVSHKTKRPSALFLGGDQVYGDHYASLLIRPTQALATRLFGFEEPLPGVKNPHDLLVRGRKNLLLSLANFTSDESHNHLMTFGEFCAAYLLAWNDHLWDFNLPSTEAILADMDPDEIPSDPEEFFANEKENLEEYIEGIKAIKRVFANTPTYMIFDDHEITDDWYLNPVWKKNVNSSALGRRIVANGLASFWLFQALGNLPAYYGNKENDLSQTIKNYVENIHNPRSAQAKDYEKRLSQYSDKWSFVTATYPGVLFTNLRTRRTSTRMEYLEDQENQGARLMNTGELAKIRKLLREMSAKDRRIIILTPTPVYGLHTLELLQKLGSLVDINKVDNESFLADPRSYYDLMDILLKLPNRPELVTFLAGDVHMGYSVSALINSPKRRNKSSLPIAHFTSSPTKNVSEGGFALALKFFQFRLIESFEEIFVRHWHRKNRDEFKLTVSTMRNALEKHFLFFPDVEADLLDIYKIHKRTENDLIELRNNWGFMELGKDYIKNQLLIWTDKGLESSLETNWPISKDNWTIEFPEEAFYKDDET